MLIHTAYYYNEYLFADGEIHNPQYKRVILLVSEQTGIPVDKILSRDERSEQYLYARHLVHYFLHAAMGYSPTAIKECLGVVTCSVYNSVKNISQWVQNRPFVTRDVMLIHRALEEI